MTDTPTTPPPSEDASSQDTTSQDTKAQTEGTAPQPDPSAHILVVEDDRRIRDLLGRFLKDQGYRVTLAASAEEARGLLAGLAFDLMVLDIMLPGESGLELTRSLRQADDVPIILLTARGEPEDRIRGLEHGADDYLAKPFEPMELLLRVKSILKRTFTEDTDEDEEVRLGQCRYDPVRGELMRDDESIKLTSGENMLLRLFAQNPGKTFSRLDLCQELGVPQERSIDVQVTRLRRKIEDDPKAPLYLQTVRGIGYVLIPG